MSGYRLSRAPMLLDSMGRPVGVVGGDGKEYFFPRFSDDQQSLIRTDGSAVSGQGSGYVLPVATSTTLGGVKPGAGISVDSTTGVMTAGATIALTSDDALSARALVYVKSTGRIGLADATAEGKEAIGYVNAAVAANGVANVFFTGSIISGFSGMTPGAAYFLSTTPGTIVPMASAPQTAGNVLMQIGTALTATDLLFAPQQPITL